MTTTEKIPVKNWYSSEHVRRHLGGLSKEVSQSGRCIYLLGTEDQPLVVLQQGGITTYKKEIIIFRDTAIGDWSSIISAILFYGTIFRIKTKNTEIVLRRHHVNKHPALCYRRPSEEDLESSVGYFLDEMRMVVSHFDDLIKEISKTIKRGET